MSSFLSNRASEAGSVVRARGKGIHDDIDPQQLDRSKDGLLIGRSDSRDKSDDDGSDVGQDLELQELVDGVVNAVTPHDRFHNQSEVVVHENDIGCLLHNFCIGNTHREPDVCCLEGRTIVRTVTCDANNPTISPSERRVSTRIFCL